MPKATKGKSPKATSDAKPAPRPVSVKVGLLEYSIRWIDDKVWRGMNTTSNVNIGEHQGPQGTIEIRLVPLVLEDTLREVLWHEIMHAVWYVCNFNDKPSPVEEDAQGNDQEERIISGTSFMFAQVIRDNPDVMAYLGGQLWKVKVEA